MAASRPLELLEDVVGEGLVEVSRDGELAGTQSEWARLRRRNGPRMDFRKRLPATDNEERFARLNAPQEGEKVAQNFLYADGTHGRILAEVDGRTSHRCKPQRHYASPEKENFLHSHEVSYGASWLRDQTIDERSEYICRVNTPDGKQDCVTLLPPETVLAQGLTPEPIVGIVFSEGS